MQARTCGEIFLVTRNWILQFDFYLPLVGLMGLNKVQESNKNKTGKPFNFKCCAIYDGTINGAYDGSNDKVSGTTGTS